MHWNAETKSFGRLGALDALRGVLMEELEPEVAARFAQRTRLSDLGRDEAHIASGGSNTEGQSRFGRASAQAPR
eukprot:2881250-Rhodomonas_salina.1